MNIRDYFKASTTLPAKKNFIDHTSTWMNPKTAALGVLQAEMDLSRNSATDTKYERAARVKSPTYSIFECLIKIITMPNQRK